MKPKVEQRPIDHIYEEYNSIYQHIKYPALVYPAIILMMFGVLTVAWAISFPHLAFLGKYNGFVNWASFLIAAVIYYYLRLSPVISYATLFLLFSFSYIIIQLEGWQKVGGWPLLTCGSASLLLGLLLSLINDLHPVFVRKSITHGLLWLWVSVAKKFNIKY